MSQGTVFKGIAACPGVAVGPLWVLDRGGAHPPRVRIPEDRADEHVERVHAAISRSRDALSKIRDSLVETHGEAYGQLIEPQLLMYGDSLLLEGIERAIRERRMSAEWAVRDTVDRLKTPLLEAEARYFRERAEDVEQVGLQILRELAGEDDGLPPRDAEVIVVANVLSPADAAELRDSRVLGIATESGSATSHAAILARALGLPAVVAAKGVARRSEVGHTAIVDAIRGEVVVDPGPAERAEAERRADRYQHFSRDLRAHQDAPVVTTDGHPVEIHANVELSFEIDRVVAARATGVGLFRTEFLFLNRRRPPTEEEQYAVYASTVEKLEGRPVVFRTFDLGADKMPRFEGGIPLPSATFGRTGLRYSLSVPALFETQLRAIVRAAAHGPARVMFPGVSGLDELLEATEVLERVRRKLSDEGVALEAIPAGSMIEIPSAALRSHRLAESCDFLSVGTNDLIQHTLAVDRTDAGLTHLSSALDPAVLDLLQMTAASASAKGIPLSMCGDMAADPLALPVVLGLGYTRLSAPLGMIPIVQETVRRLELDRCRALAGRALACSSAAAVRALVVEACADELGTIWREQGITGEAIDEAS
jgi:phosphoenolpyruvate-protein phosphotransferase (PTS system enzyme I)